MNLMFRIIIGLQRALGWLLTPFFRCREKTPTPIPKITNEILKDSATNLAQKIRNKEITCLEVIKAYIDRIELVNPYLNAVIENRFAFALEDAKKIDRIIASGDLTPEYIATKYPLFGVPVTIKESCSLEGLSYCVGSKKRIGFKAKLDGDAVHKLKEAGAIPLLVSSTPELCLAWETTNLVTGRTFNPYNINYTSGGSSGGEGALLGSGASVIGLGSDVAGSIRLPALFNGVFGHKPTPKIISITGHVPNSSDNQLLEYLVVGPLTRYAEDLKLMTRVMAEDPKKLNLDEKVDLSKLNVYFMTKAEKSCVMTNIDEEIESVMKECVSYLNNCGLTVSDYKFDMANTCEMSGTLFYGMDDIPNVLRDPINGEEKHSLYFEIIKAFFGLSDHSLHGLFFYFLQRNNIFVPRSKYGYYEEKAKLLKNDFISKLGNSGVFLYPTFPVPSLKNNYTIFNTAEIIYTMVFNVLGMPATHVTLGRNKEGFPIGIQVVAAPYQDRLCFAVAEELGKQFGGWTEP